jgi:hypothetical protein
MLIIKILRKYYEYKCTTHLFLKLLHVIHNLSMLTIFSNMIDINTVAK